MSKKPISIDLDDLVEDSAPVEESPATPKEITTDGPTNWEQVNIRVREGFKKEFRMWCMRHDRSMGDALAEAYEMLKEKHGA